MSMFYQKVNYPNRTSAHMRSVYSSLFPFSLWSVSSWLGSFLLTRHYKKHLEALDKIYKKKELKKDFFKTEQEQFNRVLVLHNKTHTTGFFNSQKNNEIFNQNQRVMRELLEIQDKESILSKSINNKKTTSMPPKRTVYHRKVQSEEIANENQRFAYRMLKR